jgi:hypothetical protein
LKLLCGERAGQSFATKRSALDLANAKFKERNKTRMEMGIAPLKAPPSRVSGEFIDTFEAKVIGLLNTMVYEHKTGATL